MPLVIITGIPSSGKSSRCSDLVQFLEENSDRPVLVVSESSYVSDRDAVYSSPALEKDARSGLKSELVRRICPSSWLIVDALNYIKGFRYELFCVGKNCRCPQLTLHCATDAPLAWQWNDGRSAGYSRGVFDALVARYEPPHADCRWDRPLLHVMPEEPTPCQRVLDVLLGAAPPAPNQSTQNPILAPTDFLQELDRRTQQLVAAVLQERAAGAIEGDRLMLPGCSEPLLLAGPLTLAQLTRHRRQFIGYMKSRPAQADLLPDMFVHYLNNAVVQ